jgi:tRNA modification GTPase
VIDTIFARATAAGRAAVAIVRISGPDAGPALQKLAGALPKPRQAAVRVLRDAGGEHLDQALVLWMPAPASFTGEDCVELHVHGGPAVLEAVSDALEAQGLRAAAPGEFSRRAFARGKLDLLQAEAVSDLVNAETAAQRRQAMQQMAGDVGRAYEGWRDRLIEALSFIEAENDFPDEDLPGALALRARPLLEAVVADLRSGLSSSARGRRVREGYSVALIGAPNAGKSSLINALLGREAAIVSHLAGTTRDVVEGDMVVEGYAVTLADTAGLRISHDEVEAEGVRRAELRAEQAAWRLLVVDPAQGPASEAMRWARPGDLVVLTKSDQGVARPEGLVSWVADQGLDVVQASVVTPGGVDALRSRLSARVVEELGGSEPPLATRVRHVEAIQGALEALERASAVLGTGPERAAEDVRLAVRALQSVIGDVDREAVLDRVFGSFCIGK